MRRQKELSYEVLHEAALAYVAQRETSSAHLALVLRRRVRRVSEPPEQAAAIILKHVERRQPRAIVGGDARVMAFMQRLFPVGYWWWLQKGRDTTRMQLNNS